MNINQIYIDSLSQIQLNSKKCQWPGCDKKNHVFPQLSNLKRHMLNCKSSARCKMEMLECQGFAQSVQNNIMDSTEIDWDSTPNIDNQNWGWSDYDNNVIEHLVLYLEKGQKHASDDRNLVNFCLNKRLSQNISPSVKHNLKGQLELFVDGKWINNRNDSFRENIGKLKGLWYQTVEKALKHWLILEKKNIGLITRCYRDIGIEYGKGNVQQDIDECYNELTKPGGIIYDDAY
tara:strand:- start:173 stop:871 length:699 start_codon:yes stop_codon:yes gene_type:complete